MNNDIRSKTVMISIKKAIVVFLILNLLIIFSSIWFDFVWFINIQSSFMCSFVVTIASLFGYKKVIENEVKILDGKGELDILQKIEDPYEIYEEEDKKPKASLMEQGAQRAKISALGYFSPYRLVGYVIFLIIFLMLLKSSYFSIVPFLIGTMVTPFGVLFYILIGKNNA